MNGIDFRREFPTETRQFFTFGEKKDIHALIGDS